MRLARSTILFLGLSTTLALAADDFIDRLDETLTVSALEHQFRARLSGTLDFEGYFFQQPAPALIYAPGTALFNPRLSLFLDGQLGRRVYFFAQARADRGFDPSDEHAHIRLDEYAARFTPWLDGRLNLQAGKFATVVGNWVARHDSWDNPFVTAPLLYENLTGVWDVEAPPTDSKLLQWAHVQPGLPAFVMAIDKYRRLPIIWGPSYTSGFAVSGAQSRFYYALEVKDAALASRPSTWTSKQEQWIHPTVSGRVGYQPNEMWRLGFSASDGAFLLPAAEPTLAPGHGRGDYREQLLAQDVSFAWHHVQAWAEFYEARFILPNLHHADTFAYYVEAKYKFTPQFFGSLRWNEQRFGSIPDGAGGTAHWGHDTWRVDVAPAYRITPHAEFKLQYSLQHEADDVREHTHTFAAQFVVRF